MSEATTGQPVETPAETPGSSTAPIKNNAVDVTETHERTNPESESVTNSGDAAPSATEGGEGDGSGPTGTPRTGQNRRRRGSRGGRGRGRSGTGGGTAGPASDSLADTDSPVGRDSPAGRDNIDEVGSASADSPAGTDSAAGPDSPAGTGNIDEAESVAPVASVKPVTAAVPDRTDNSGRTAPGGPASVAGGPAPAAPPMARPRIGDTRPGTPVVPEVNPRPGGGGAVGGGAGGARAGNGRRTGSNTGSNGGARDGGRGESDSATVAPEPKRSTAAKSQQGSRGADATDRSGDGPNPSSRRGGRERRGKAVGRYMIAVHVQPHLTQIALLEGRTLVEHYVSRATDDDTQIDGNIYRGRVQNVLPGMEAAFIDIGTPKNAVLYRGDVRYDTDDVESGASGQPRIEEVLRPGQTILCQVTKNPIGAKGARLTQEVSLPGRFVVLVPNSTAYGISKRLDDGERKRLRKIVDAIRPKGHGLIVRTAAAGASAEELSNDVERLVAEWQGIAADALKGSGAALLYQEPDIAVRVIREELNREYRGVVIDDLALFEQVRDYVSAVNPELADRVEYYDPAEEPLPVFERFHVHEQLHKALDRKVFLPSGGSLVIDRTEALDSDRRQHREERRQDQPGRDRLPQQLGGGRRGGPPAAVAGHRRDHRHRLHRHGDPGEPGQGG